MKQQDKITLTFLGTGTSTGVPMVASTHPVRKSTDSKDKRLRSSILVSWNNCNYVVDCGPDFRQQMLKEEVNSINGIIYTHEHADHIAGLDDIRGFYFKQGKIPIYTSERVLKVLQKRFDYIFATENRYPSAPEVEVNLISHKENFTLNNLEIVPIQVMHGNLPILGYRFGNIAYLTDIKSVSIEEKDKLKNLDVLIVTGLRYEPHATHFNIKEALSFVKEINPKKTYLTHISELLGFHKDVEKCLPENVFLAYDGLKITS